jgi:adenosylcobinamide-GDP ribazoletransferase
MRRQALLFLVAVQFLTRLPVPRLDGFQASWLSESARYFPLIGALVGLLGAGTWWLGSLCFAPAVAVGLMMCATLLVTGAFHEDGLADSCDGFGGGRTREARLAIMKDSRIGAFGAIGVVMMLGLKWSALVSLPHSALPLIVIGAHMVSRWCAIGLIWRLPYVREDADAKSKPFAGRLSFLDWLSSGALGALMLLGAVLLLGHSADFPWARILLGGSAFGLAAAVLAGAYFKSRIGGYTGDCLGAAQQVSELSFLLAALGILAGMG